MQLVAILSLAALASAKVIPRGKFAKDANESAVPRIIGGRPASTTEFQSTAYLEMYDGTSGSICTGSLIAPNVILTAGHCLYKDQTRRYLAADFQVGITHAPPPPSQLFKGISVTQVIAHPKFSMSDLVDDIALLILSESVPATTATPIKIYSGSYKTSTPIRAAGFGLTDPLDDTSVASQLMVVDLGIGSQSLCQKNSNTYDPKTQLCTDGTAGKDTCQGDSGGPLITPIDSSANYALLGLTSYGTTSASNPQGLCAVKGSSGFYTYIAPYLPWIAEMANLDVKSIQITNSTSSGGDEDSSSPSSRSRTSSKSRNTRTSTNTRSTDTEGDSATDDSSDSESSHHSHDSHSSGASRVHAGLAAASIVIYSLLF
ncbi:hypothetical protein LPJ61_001121 [Coemansia biformis]|uniref:Peptidase S1 domain-containing protein n=1 Tax=Coemansia biformis TaxID=1286918 RepID=A0A9W7YFR9_9FUNG|nr:hypothetical protein LPJ61_001121 [Coemansia biformis]